MLPCDVERREMNVYTSVSRVRPTLKLMPRNYRFVVDSSQAIVALSQGCLLCRDGG